MTEEMVGLGGEKKDGNFCLESSWVVLRGIRNGKAFVFLFSSWPVNFLCTKLNYLCVYRDTASRAIMTAAHSWSKLEEM